MSSLTDQGRETVDSLARQTGFSPSAVEAMLRSIVRGGGGMAQFDHPEFGGSGQWMRGGMLMISDFSDRDLKRRVGDLCEALSAWIEREPFATGESRFQSQSQGSGPVAVDDWPQGSRLFEPQVPWYPASLGRPDSSGSQNQTRYAWFGAAHRLAIDDGHGVIVYDTGDHRIGGVSQQQGPGGTVSFVSQHGIVDAARLPIVDEGWGTSPPMPATQAAPTTAHDPFVAIEKLADLHARGVLDDAEFATKKAELLQRI